MISAEMHLQSVKAAISIFLLDFVKERILNESIHIRTISDLEKNHKQ